MKLTKHSQRLREFATRILPKVASSADAVAITGSVARGNAQADSDLDLWVLGTRSGRVVRHLDGVSVTLLCQRPAEATQFDNLCFYEVDDLVVLQRGSGAFDRLLATWKRSRSRVRREIIRGTRAQIRWEFERAERGTPLHQAVFLRFACWRLLCLRLFITRGWRVPRLHLLREELPPALRAHLDGALALPPAAQCRRAVKLLPAALKEVQRIAGDDGYALPESIAEKAALAPDEAAMVARKELVFELLPRVFRQFGITDVRGVELLDRVAPSLKVAFLALEPRADDATVKSLRARLRAIERAR